MDITIDSLWRRTDLDLLVKVTKVSLTNRVSYVTISGSTICGCVPHGVFVSNFTPFKTKEKK